MVYDGEHGDTYSLVSRHGLEGEEEKISDEVPGKDRNSKLPPLHLKGRCEEKKTLQTCFEMAKESKQLVLISGGSGIGKSTLARHVKESTSALYAEGKYTLHKEDKPFSAIAQACDQICDQLRASSDFSAFLDKLRLELTVGNTGMLFRVLPSVAGVLDADQESTGPGKVGASRADDEVKLRLALRRFLRVVSHYVQLVLVIDDVHYADKASLDLLEFILSDRKNSGFMVICCYRNNEMDEGHPFHNMVANVQRNGNLSYQNEDSSTSQCDVTKIELRGIESDYVAASVHAMFECPSNENSLALSSLVYRYTEGNPLFMKQFLSWLMEEGLLEKNLELSTWTWNIDQIEYLVRERNSMDMVSLVRARISMLATETQDILKCAALLGTAFPYYVLAWVVDDYEHRETNKASAEDGMSVRDILGVGEKLGCLAHDTQTGMVVWSHDEVQEAVRSMIPLHDFPKLSFRVGSMLRMKLTSNSLLMDNLFLLVRLLNTGSICIPSTKASDKVEIAELNLKAGKLSIESLMFSRAAMYFGKGCALLPHNCWRVYNELTMDLYSYAGESMHYNGQLEESDKYCRSIIQRVNISLLNKRRAYSTLIMNAAAKGQADATIDTCIELLGLLGCPIPKRFRLVRSIPSLLKARSAVDDIISANGSSSIAFIDDEHRQWVMTVLEDLCDVGYLADRKDIFVTAIVNSYQWTGLYGICEESAPAFAQLAVALIISQGAYDEAMRYSDHALKLLSLFDSKRHNARTYFLVYALIQHWQRDFNEEGLKKGYEAGVASGDMEAALRNKHFIIGHQIVSRNLMSMARTLQEYAIETKDHGIRTTQAWCALNQQMVSNLRGEASLSSELNGEYIELEGFVEMIKEGYYGKPVFMEATLRLTQLRTAFYFDDFKRMFQIRKIFNEKRIAKLLPNTFYLPLLAFAVSLSAISLYRETRRTKYKSLALGQCKHLSRWVKVGVSGYQLFLNWSRSCTQRSKNFRIRISSTMSFL